MDTANEAFEGLTSNNSICRIRERCCSGVQFVTLTLKQIANTTLTLLRIVVRVHVVSETNKGR